MTGKLLMPGMADRRIGYAYAANTALWLRLCPPWLHLCRKQRFENKAQGCLKVFVF